MKAKYLRSPMNIPQPSEPERIIMQRETWQKVKRILSSAIDLDPAARTPFIHQACGSDYDLLREVTELLAKSGETENFIERPALELLRPGGSLS